MNYRLNFTVSSDRGLVRGNNEDSAYAGPNLLVLADGMGGHAAGEVASALMVEHLEKLDRDPGDNDMLALLGSFADDANAAIAQMIRQRPETDGMGTTLTAVMFNGRNVGLIHVGDSRGYRLRDGRLTQLTVDDTFVQSLVDEGKLDPADVSTHPQKSLILKAYTGMPVDPTLQLIDVRPGDRLLLCSDGLSDPVTASTIEAALGEGDPGQAAQRLVELALRSGGPDNVTVIVADVLDEAALTDVDKRHLPTQPVTGGALAGEAEPPTHPNTSAGRAAALRKPVTVPPGQAGREPEAAAVSAPAEDDDAEDDPRHGSGKWFLIAAALVLVLGLIGTGWWMLSRLDDQYYLAVDDEENFVIEKGADFSLFGRDMHTPLQQACLDSDDNVQLIEAGEAPDGCALFGLDDLPQSVRGSVDALEAGTYDDVTRQLQRLADEALPVCVSSAQDGRNGDEADQADQADEADEDAGQDEQPGVNCRVV